MTHNRNRPQGQSSTTTEQLFGYLDRIEQKIDRLMRISKSIIQGEEIIMSQLTDALDQAEAAAAANSQADDAAEALLVSISQMLKDAVANGTPAEQIARVSALASGLTARAAQLGTAVAANTPAAPGGSTGGIGGSTGGV